MPAGSASGGGIHSRLIGKPQTELELASTLATLFSQGLDLQQAMNRAKEGDIKCQACLPDVATYVQRFAGGQQFPLVFFLAKFAKQFGSALMVGSEFMSTLANLDFKRPGNMYPFIRMAAWACMVTGTHKATDGLAKILTVTDLFKLKSQACITMTEEAELVMQDAWKTMETLIQASQAPGQKVQDSHYQKAFGKLAIRLILFICQKQKVSREPKKNLSSITEILEQFTTDCKSPEANHSSAAADTQSEAREVNDLLTATPATMALPQNSHLKIGEM